MILVRDAYSILGEERMRLAEELSAELRGKTTSESLDIILKYMPRITAGKRLSEEERRVVLSTIRESMNDTEKMKLDEILSVLGM